MNQLVRRPAGRPPVPPDRIIAMALRIVDEEGTEALSMRALAERLGSGTATLYRHFGKRAAWATKTRLEQARIFAAADPSADRDARTGWCGGSLGIPRAVAVPPGTGHGSRGWRAGR
ncbi:helix-turn-helix domain-containing protein [Streptomyces sp. NPDC091217]|uniref:helix-turn-helix domain-containing protein n=1 Tax=Streptomyces sp. NPDC091217 TaxID=3365975 RepID=UPI0038090F94